MCKRNLTCKKSVLGSVLFFNNTVAVFQNEFYYLVNFGTLSNLGLTTAHYNRVFRPNLSHLLYKFLMTFYKLFIKDREFFINISNPQLALTHVFRMAFDANNETESAMAAAILPRSEVIEIGSDLSVLSE